MHRRAAGAAAALLAVLALLAHAAGGVAQTGPTLSDAQLAGQHVIFSFPGRTPPRALLDRIGRGEAAGVILFRRNIGSRAGLRAMLRRLQSVPRPSALSDPLIVMIDQEGGQVKRLSGAPRHSAGALGHIGSIKLARNEGIKAAHNLRLVGVNTNLAPVADVARAGSDEERTLRSYGSNPRKVAALAGAFTEGLHAGGVAATAKHFPGIGAARADADRVTPRIRLSKARLRATDERPFRTLVGRNVELVMLANAVYPAFGSRPVFLSPALAQDELRGRLGFSGVTMTDDLQTRSATRFGVPSRLAAPALRAGADLLLYASSYVGGAAAANAVASDLVAGRLSREDLQASLDRILSLRAGLPR
jgi:beta-N-acetylhexosaminidase